MIKVLVIDDSAIVRRVLSEKLAEAADIEVVGTAMDPFVAREKIIKLRPDVVTLDLDMPRMDGLTFLGKLMKYYPMPVIVVSALTPKNSEAALRALELGAVDVVAKPGSTYSVGEIGQMIVDKIRAAMAVRSRARFGAPQLPPLQPAPEARTLAGVEGKILAVGASTGGTEAIKAVLMGLPANIPGTLIVQHMPANFTAPFAERLNKTCPMEVREARHNDPVTPGTALIAPGNRHMTLRRKRDQYYVEIKNGPAVHHQRPSVDVLFHSVAQQAGPNAVGVILTGMGGDGAQGLLAMRQAGARTMAQDEESSVVFGMPKEAIQIKAAEKVVALPDMALQIMDALSGGATGAPGAGPGKART